MTMKQSQEGDTIVDLAGADQALVMAESAAAAFEAAGGELSGMSSRRSRARSRSHAGTPSHHMHPRGMHRGDQRPPGSIGGSDRQARTPAGAFRTGRHRRDCCVAQSRGERSACRSPSLVEDREGHRKAGSAKTPSRRLPELGDRIRRAVAVEKARVISSGIAAKLTQRANSDVKDATYGATSLVKVAARDPHAFR